MAMVQFWIGYPRVSSFVGLGSGMISHPWFSDSAPQNLSDSALGGVKPHVLYIEYLVITLFTYTIKFILH